MRKINVKNFSMVDFFLASRKEVTSLAEAKTYGGVTKFNEKFYSNYEDGDFITLNKKINSLSIIIPSTLDADKAIDNSEYVKNYSNILAEKYGKIQAEKSVGSWYSDNLDKIIVEENCIITVTIEGATEEDINFILDLGLKVKEDMRQEAVSTFINDSLCIV